MKKYPDWSLVTEALSSLKFLRYIGEPENQFKQVGEVIDHHINAKNGSAPLSPGALVAFAHIAIVYSKENAIFGLPGELLTHRFSESQPCKSNHELLKNLRHAISHGDFEVIEERMYFYHDGWQASIILDDLAAFLDEVHIKIRAQHLIGWAYAAQKKREANKL